MVTVSQAVFDYVAEQRRYWQDRAEQEANARDTAEQNRRVFQVRTEEFRLVLEQLEVAQ